MKHVGNIILALLLAVISMSVDRQAVENALTRQTVTHISASLPYQEFVLVKTTQLPDLASESKSISATPLPQTPAIETVTPFYHVVVPKSNTAFMSQRNCVCIPLRL